jgi:hypothetical protein
MRISSLVPVLACAAPNDEQPANESNFTSSSGTPLTDGNLTVVLDFVDGAAAETRGKRFLRATTTRNHRHFDTWCELQAEPGKTSLYCSKLVRTGENRETDDPFDLWFDDPVVSEINFGTARVGSRFDD